MAGLIEKETLALRSLSKSECWKNSKKEEWILIYEKQLDRINRIIRIEQLSAEGPLAAGEKNLVNPVNPV